MALMKKDTSVEVTTERERKNIAFQLHLKYIHKQTRLAFVKVTSIKFDRYFWEEIVW